MVSHGEELQCPRPEGRLPGSSGSGLPQTGDPPSLIGVPTLSEVLFEALFKVSFLWLRLPSRSDPGTGKQSGQYEMLSACCHRGARSYINEIGILFSF